MTTTVVVGAGIAGLTAALRLRQGGHRVHLVTKGIGGLQLSQGTVDILGYDPQRVTSPMKKAATHRTDLGTHPYEVIGADNLRAGVDFLRQVLGEHYLVGDVERNVALPTAVGAARPTALYPPSMAEAVLRKGNQYLVVGLRRLKDFFPDLVAQNLCRVSVAGEFDAGEISARAVMVDLQVRPDEVDTTSLNSARALEKPDVLDKFVALIAPHVRDGEIVLVPAVLGVQGAGVYAQLREKLGHPIAEVPLAPPSVPGMRLNQQLLQVCKDARVDVRLGAVAVGLVTQGRHVRAVEVHAAGGVRALACDHVVLAAGGFESGALTLNSHRQVEETVFGLPVRTTGELLHGDYWGPQQPLFAAGVAVDEQMRVLDGTDALIHPNLHAIGGILAGAIRWHEKLGEGIALGSMFAATEAILTATNDAEANHD